MKHNPPSNLSDADLMEYHKMFQDGMEGSKRFESRKTHNVDVKFLYHIIRLLSQCEQILIEEDLDLREKGRREHMKAIRKGEVSEEDTRKWAADKEKQLEKLYAESTLPHSPDQKKIQALLESCLEEHYGRLEGCIVHEDAALRALREVQEILDRNAAVLR